VRELFTAIMTKTVGSALSTSVGGRIYLDEAPQEATLPYVVFFIVTSYPTDTFTEKIEDTLVQFSIFSALPGATEISTIYENLTTLFDGCDLTITGDTHIWMQRRHLATMIDEITTATGTFGMKHWAVDYSIMVQD